MSEPVSSSPEGGSGERLDATVRSDRMPVWIWKAAAVFWLGFLLTLAGRDIFHRVANLLIIVLVSLFVSLAVEPGVDKLVSRGMKRGQATGLILFAVFAVTVVFFVAIGTLVAAQIADLLGNSEKYVRDTVQFLNDTFNTRISAKEVIDSINDPNGAVQRFIDRQQTRVFDLSAAALGFLLGLFSVLLFSFYLVADGPKLRRAICSRLRPDLQRRVLDTWELAITKTGGYLYSRAVLAGLSALFHWVVFQILGTTAPVALALWVGLVSQFLPVIGTYIAGILPVLLTFIDSPPKALIVLSFVVVYQQIENYLFAPRITARTLDVHPAVAFGAALAGAAVLGPVGAVLALPLAAMAQAVGSSWGHRHEVVVDHLVAPPEPPGPNGTTEQRHWRRRLVEGLPEEPTA